MRDVEAVTIHSVVERLPGLSHICLLYTSPSPRDGLLSRMPSSAWKAKETGELEAVDSQVHPRRPRRIQRPNPSALSDFSEDGVLLPAHIDDHYRQIGLVMALTIKVVKMD